MGRANYTERDIANSIGVLSKHSRVIDAARELGLSSSQIKHALVSRGLGSPSEHLDSSPGSITLPSQPQPGGSNLDGWHIPRGAMPPPPMSRPGMKRLVELCQKNPKTLEQM